MGDIELWQKLVIVGGTIGLMTLAYFLWIKFAVVKPIKKEGQN